MLVAEFCYLCIRYLTLFFQHLWSKFVHIFFLFSFFVSIHFTDTLEHAVDPTDNEVYAWILPFKSGYLWLELLIEPSSPTNLVTEA